MTAVAWQGWKLDLPEGWNPVRLVGDFHKGQALFVDLERPRLGLRWETLRSLRADPGKAIEQAFNQEVGQLASQEVRDQAIAGADWDISRLYVEPEPPGRNVWIGFSRGSNRLLQIVQHVQRRENLLVDAILPALADSDPAVATPWSIFELSCIAPAGMQLRSQRLLAGDLSLTFADKHGWLTVRQVAVAELALARMKLERWLANQQELQRTHYVCDGPPTDARTTSAGLVARSRRRWRFFWNRRLPLELITYALHDKGRDRLVLLEGADDALIKLAANSVGWAQRNS